VTAASIPDAMTKAALAAATICCLAGASLADVTWAQGFGFNAGPEPRYPANPQYQYPSPYDAAAQRQKHKCRPGEVLHRGKCRPARPLALPF
jgi:hypothetical protein